MVWQNKEDKEFDVTNIARLIIHQSFKAKSKLSARHNKIIAS